MAVIIVAIAIILLDAYMFLRRRIELIRTEEKFIYDTIFVREFFQCINCSYDWKEFFSKKHKISVSRKVSHVKASTTNFSRSDGVYFETKGTKCLEKSEKRVYCLEYEFDVDSNMIKLYTFLPSVYRGWLSKIKGTIFSFELDPNTRKINFINSFDDKIYSGSRQTIFQGLAFALESRVQRFKDSFGVCFDFLHETIETRSIGFKVLKRWQTLN